MAESSTSRPARAPWDRNEMPGRFSVEETARRVGNYKWVEMRIFELLGGWVGSVPEPDLKLRLGTHCYHHAFHAELWHKRLPQLREMDPTRLTLPANPAIEAFMDALGDNERASDTLTKLVGMYRVLLPHLIAAYTFHRNNTASITDAPTIRALDFALADDLEEWRDGEMMIQSLIHGPGDVDRALERQAELEKMMLAAGGVTGAGSVSSFGP
ncbi:MAG: hypothetical protein R2710_21300 [Acidimicrobiales bacterium]